MNGRFSAIRSVGSVDARAAPVACTPCEERRGRAKGLLASSPWKIHWDVAASDSRPYGRVSGPPPHLGPGTCTRETGIRAGRVVVPNGQTGAVGRLRGSRRSRNCGRTQNRTNSSRCPRRRRVCRLAVGLGFFMDERGLIGAEVGGSRAISTRESEQEVDSRAEISPLGRTVVSFQPVAVREGWREARAAMSERGRARGG